MGKPAASSGYVLVLSCALLTGCDSDQSSKAAVQASKNSTVPKERRGDPPRISAIDGYRTIKFGMSESDIAAAKICDQILPNYHVRVRSYANGGLLCFEVDGKWRDAMFWFSKETHQLESIVVYLGQHSDNYFAQLASAIRERYEPAYQFTDTEIALFNSQQVSNVWLAFANYQVALEIYRDRDMTSPGIKLHYMDARAAQGLATSLAEWASKTRKPKPRASEF